MNNIFAQLKELLKDAYCPYSKYRVASLVDTDKGLFKGVNVECGSYGLTICSEQSSIVSAISNGAKEFNRLYLLTSSTDVLGTPCGKCRQIISEHFKDEQEIVIFDLKGNYKIFKVNELLPFGWKPSTLNNI